MNVAFAFCEYEGTLSVWFAKTSAIAKAKAGKKIDMPLSMKERNYIDEECEKRGYGVTEQEDCADGMSRECDIVEISKINMDAATGVPELDDAIVTDKKLLTAMFLEMGLKQDPFYDSWAQGDEVPEPSNLAIGEFNNKFFISWKVGNGCSPGGGYIYLHNDGVWRGSNASKGLASDKFSTKKEAQAIIDKYGPPTQEMAQAAADK